MATVLASAVGISPVQAKIGGIGLRLLWSRCRPVVLTTIALVSAAKIYSYGMKKYRRMKWAQVEKDIVILHSFPRGKFCPNLSPFVLKLETYLRLANIPYQVEFVEPMGPKGKSPWITLNGEEFTDSQLIVEMLGDKYDKHFSEHLSSEQWAVGKAMQVMTEEHLYWCLIIWRYVTDPHFGALNCIELSVFMQLMVRFIKFWNVIKKSAWTHGLGRHTPSDIEHFCKDDLKSISLYLGNKTFLMGDEPCEVDCAVFGMISQFIWNAPGSPYLTMINTDFHNLSSYCDRMKERLWPDWDECINPPKKE